MSEAPDALDWQQDFIATSLLAIGYNAWGTMHLLKLAHPCVEMSVGVTSDLVGRVGKFKQVFARGSD